MVRRYGRRPVRLQKARVRSVLRRELRLLEGVALALFVALIVGMFLFSAITRIALRTGQGAAVVSAVLVDLANGDRASGNVGLLTVSPALTAAAQAKANDMAAKSYFAHVAPDGKDSWYWFKQQNYSFDYAGENLAVDFSDSADVERAWMQSPSHRQNLLDPHFTEIGIAIAEGTYQGHPTTFVVQMFGKPKASLASAAPIQQITSPQSPTEPAIATTQNTNVLGSTVEESPQKPAPIAQVKPAPKIVPKPAQEDDNAEPVPVPATKLAKEPAGAIVHYAPNWAFMAASPKTTLKYVYYLLALIILTALFITTELEFRWHHRKQFVIAACLLVFMSSIFVIADHVVFSDPIVASVPGAQRS